MVIFGLIMTLLGIASVLVGVIGAIVAFWPITLEWGWTVNFFEYMDLVFYLVPVGDLWPLFYLIFILAILRFGIALVKSLLDFIPFF